MPSYLLLQGICEHVIKYDNSGKITSVKRGCQSRGSCSHESLGPDGQDCADSTSGQTCTHCDYGEQDEDHVCKLPGIAYSFDNIHTYFPSLIEHCEDILNVTENTNVCILGADSGTGSSSETRYFYRPDKGRCVEFIYKGSGGNGNNFNTKEECEEQCKGATIPGEVLPIEETYTFDVPQKNPSFNIDKGQARLYCSQHILH